MKLKLIGIALILSFCASVFSENVEQYKIYRLEANYGVMQPGLHVIEYEGNKYVVIVGDSGVAVCPALPAIAEEVK